MPAYDTFHEAVKRGLTKDGWTITDDPLRIEIGLLNVYVDLGAERLIAAERASERIAVEVKSFIGPSLLTDFHLALGQFLNYRNALRARDPGRALYLAVPVSTYDEFFWHVLIQQALRDFSVRLILYDPEKETLERWVT
jgi:hypothetical protein